MSKVRTPAVAALAPSSIDQLPSRAAAQAVPANPGDIESPLTPFDGASVLTMLFDRARPSLSLSELRWLEEGSSQLAESIARYSSRVANGVGCLVSGDDGAGGSICMGSLQGHDDVPQMLFHFGAVFDQLAGLIAVRSMAADDIHSATER